MIGSSLLRYNTDQVYCCFDVETEGLNLRYHRPWQVAWIVFKGNEILDKKSHYLRWEDLNISAESALISHFDPRTYKAKAEDPAKILPNLDKYIYDPSVKLVGHNLFFDAYMHGNWREAIGVPRDTSWMDRLIDTNVLSKAYRKGWAPDVANYIKWQWKVADFREKGLKTSLGVMAKEFGIDFREDLAHDAGYDVYINMLVFNQLLWKVEL